MDKIKINMFLKVIHYSFSSHTYAIYICSYMKNDKYSFGYLQVPFPPQTMLIIEIFLKSSMPMTLSVIMLKN